MVALDWSGMSIRTTKQLRLDEFRDSRSGTSGWYSDRKSLAIDSCARYSREYEYTQERSRQRVSQDALG